MSPTNDQLNLDHDELETHDAEDNKRGGQPSQRNRLQRSKRIRTPRRNSINGMQRRRNKRIDW